MTEEWLELECVHLSCVNCGEFELAKYTPELALRWGSYDHELYCPKCVKLWNDRMVEKILPTDDTKELIRQEWLWQKAILNRVGRNEV